MLRIWCNSVMGGVKGMTTDAERQRKHRSKRGADGWKWIAIQISPPAYSALGRLTAFWSLSRRETIEKILMAEDLKTLRSFSNPEKRQAYMELGKTK
uniref:Uncharacterized protein n=1 Tax=Leptospirillum ferrodiazotrophum TaxID=412449 RepID=C6HW44_9BACT|nr:MAG: hypothetical protein UBAL3_80290022 [Leptospirillum ferrodiazotrophum]